ncbi:hypothetical protein [Stutzerimonas xanthomarina]|uniref:hypothetical protein n=1 Tax=Stutzerimonas xanthomarina TaxID=271420 RepID=UPI0029A289BC|nr:hypothetical protein [Stutzerimonas xanthomarina]MDX2352502.1 hypothetical protein [Stutzerimonas xanthomarina]
MLEIQKSAAAAGKALGATLAVGATAAAAALVVTIEKQRELIDTQAKSAQSLRTTYESLSTLGRAGELAGVGMDKIEGSARALEQRLGQAIQGSKEQAAAFDRLGLSAQAIADLPLDQRIATINQALRDNVQASERAAVASKVFGEEGALVIQRLDPGTIAEAARQVEIFGLNLSDVDAAKVEMANDALSTFGLLSDGVGKQLTVELAPILQLIGDEFLRAAEEAGGMGNVVQGTVQTTVTGLAFVADSADGVSRAFQVVADTIIGMLTTAQHYTTDAVADILAGLDKIPGVDLSLEVGSLRESANEALFIAREAANNIEDTLTRPLAGTAFKQLVDDAMEAADTAAVASIKSRQTAQETGRAIVLLSDASKTATKEAEKATKDLAAAQAKQASDYAALIRDLQTDEERLTEQMRERLAILDAMPGLEPDERMQVAGRIAGAATEDAPEFGGLDAAVGGAFGELLKIDEAEEKLQEWYETQLEMLEQFRQERADLSATWDEEELALKQQHEDELARIEQARQMAQLASAESVFGDLAGMAKTFAGENSGIYKAMFAVQKAAAIAQSAVAIQQGIAMAAANPWPANLAAMASVAAATASIVSNIGAIGMAHEGIDSIPQTGTWLLEKGERVTTAETSAKLDKTLSDIQGGNTGAGTTVNVIEDASKRGTTERRTGADGREEVNVFVSDIFGDGPRARAIAQKFGLSPAGR